MSNLIDIETSVLIVGAGPVGLALAGDFGWRNVPCMVIEQSDGTIIQPRQDLVGVRTMEFCRRWGIVGDVEADVKEGKISISSPIARALIGKSKGDTVEVAAPGGAHSYEVLDVKYR